MESLQQLLARAPCAIPDPVTSRIDGALVPPDTAAATLPITYPGTAEVVTQLQVADAAEVGRAVAAARASFASGVWAGMAVAERQRVLRKGQQLLQEHSATLAFLECLAAGLPMVHLQSRQVPRAAENFGFFAEFIGQQAGESFEQMPGYLTTVTRQPAGVAALLAPWNAPLALASMQLASCIAFGNSCVLKPSEYTPLSIGYMVDLLEQAGLPPGVINVVNGPGAVTGAALVAHPDIDRIAFTGGTATARAIMAAAAPRLVPLHLELGGKSANIVFDDADLEQALDGSLINIFANNGQICIAGSRILVQRGIADRFIPAFVERARHIRVGDPMDPDSEMGPLAFAAHLQRVQEHIAGALADGARLLVGGAGLPELGAGYFLQPTVLQVESNALPICQREVFGPVATIQLFDRGEEAFSIANDSEFGLVAYVWTDSLQRTLAAQQRLEVGTVWVNTPLARDLRAPFGGFKQSGMGRDGPRQCAEFYTEEKATIVARGRVPMPRLGAGGVDISARDPGAD